MKKLFKENTSLFFTSLVAVSIILTSIFYGVSLTGYKQYKDENVKLIKENNTLKSQMDSLNSENFTKDIQIGRYEIIMGKISETKEGAKILENASKNVE